MRFLSLLLVLVAPGLSPPAAAECFTFLLLTNSKWETFLWRVWSSGRAEQLTYEFPRGEHGKETGTTRPTDSPDERWVAFARDGELWLLEILTGQLTQITRIAQPYDETYASIEALVTAWSPGSQKILYAVDHGETECVDCEDRGDWEVRPAEYGFFIYDLENEVHQGIEFPGKFEAWLPDGSFLLTPAPGQLERMTQQRLLRWQPGQHTLEQVSDLIGLFGQLDVAPSGRRVLVSLGRSPGGRLNSQIVELDLVTRAARPVTQVGTWA
ncbi:MAG: hypothetical protein V3R29_01965, partial [Candidatus Acidoferrales bacterium]